MLGRAAGSLALAINQELDRREGKTEEVGDPAADYEKGYHDAEQLGDALALVNRLQITNKDGSPIAPWAFFDLASRLSELLEDLGSRCQRTAIDHDPGEASASPFTPDKKARFP